jgi:hypothetical protein
LGEYVRVSDESSLRLDVVQKITGLDTPELAEELKGWLKERVKG